jgi:hypothetical protein
MTQPLYHLLQKSEMFPRNSKCINIIQQCFSDGYKALKQILFHLHPIFHPQPATLIMSYPKQHEKTMLEYFSLFQDFLQLHAFIMDQNSSLDNPDELDVFISNTKYSQWLNQVTCDECKLTTMAHKCTANQIVEMLNTFLNEPDSPALNDECTTHMPLLHHQLTQPLPSAHHSPYHCTPVNHIAFALSLIVSLPESDDSYQLLYCELHDMDVPADAHDQYTHATFQAMVNHVQTQPLDTNATMQCIICGENHQFNNCAILQNTEFLKSHYIHFCSQLHHEATAQASTFQGSASLLPTPNTNPVNAIGVHDVTNPNIITDFPEDEASSETNEDFQTGHY